MGKKIQYQFQQIKQIVEDKIDPHIVSDKKWAKLHLHVGKLSEWKAASRRCDFPGELKSVNVFVDSTDLPIQNSDERGPASDFWSGKLKRPGYRYMMFSDAKGKILKVWSGYSPKLYDAHFLQCNKDYIEENFNGATMIGDTHFASMRNKLHGITLHAPYANVPKEPVDDDDAEDRPNVAMTKKKQKYNSDVHSVRSRAERPFADISQIFPTLDTPWREDLDQLDYLVFYACAIHNIK